jgi:hypothetical protein
VEFVVNDGAVSPVLNFLNATSNVKLFAFDNTLHVHLYLALSMFCGVSVLEEHAATHTNQSPFVVPVGWLMVCGVVVSATSVFAW